MRIVLVILRFHLPDMDLSSRRAVLKSIAFCPGGCEIGSVRFAAALILFVIPGIVSAGPIEWRTNLEGSLADARSTGKPVLLDFYADWCGYCQKLRAEVYPSTEVAMEARKFVTVTVNVDRNQRAAAKYEVEGLPTVIFLDSNGYVLDRIAGFVDARTFARRMRDATRRSSVKSDVFVQGERIDPKETGDAGVFFPRWALLSDHQRIWWRGHPAPAKMQRFNVWAFLRNDAERFQL